MIDDRAQIRVRLDADTLERVKYWASRADMSVNEYVERAIELKCRRDSGDYDLPDLTVARIAQLVEAQAKTQSDIANLSDVVTSSMRALLQLTRGDNYLLDYEEMSDNDR